MLHDELFKGRLSDPGGALLLAFKNANQRIRTASQADGRAGMSSTLVAAVIEDGRAWIANVGDSRAALVRGGHLQQLTQDHSLVTEQVLAGAITDEEAEHSDYRNVITRAVGFDETVEPDVTGPVELSPGSIILLYSDGLYRVVSNEEIAETVALHDAATAADKLVDMANRAGGPDNISVAIYRQA